MTYPALKPPRPRLMLSAPPAPEVVALLAIERWNEACAFTGQRSYTGRTVRKGAA